MGKNPIKKVTIYRYEQGTKVALNGATIIESPVTLSVNGEAWLTFMCTPVELEELGIGFLYNEGIINSLKDVASWDLCASGELLDIWLKKSIQRPDQWRRTSGCTGGMTIDRQPDAIILNQNGYLISDQELTALLPAFYEAQDTYRQAGGIHTAGLSDGERIICISEDIGRHNTLDKISGKILLENILLERKIILTTGRISSEMCQKSARMGAAIIISRTAPSSLAIEMANNYGISIIGYARKNGFQVYTHPDRILNLSASISKNPIS